MESLLHDELGIVFTRERGHWIAAEQAVDPRGIFHKSSEFHLVWPAQNDPIGVTQGGRIMRVCDGLTVQSQAVYEAHNRLEIIRNKGKRS